MVPWSSLECSPRSHRGGRWFESSRDYCGVDWSLVPARSHKPYDAGSNPASATCLAAVRRTARVCDPRLNAMGCWSNLVRLLVCTQAIGVQLPGGPLFSFLSWLL